MRYAGKRTYEWSSEIAYSVGLIASDGCLYKDLRHIALVSVDIEQLENFNRAIGRHIPIAKHHGGRSLYVRKQGYQVQFSDVAYYDFLLSVGLTPSKSKIIPALKIPDKYYGHFLRGLFDGDGSTFAYNDPRWPTSYLYNVDFASASITFLEYLSRMNKRLLHVKGESIRVSSRVSNLRYGKKDGYMIYRGMYKNAGDLYLSRKRTKLEGFIVRNNSGIILPNARVLEPGRQARLRF